MSQSKIISSIIKMDTLINRKTELSFNDYMSTRMVKSASVLDRDDFIGWSMRVPKKGLVDMRVFGSKSISENDLRWIVENTATCKSVKTVREDDKKNNKLYELYLPTSQRNDSSPIGFGNNIADTKEPGQVIWPHRYSDQFAELIKVLQTTGSELKVVLGSSNDVEQAACRKNLIATWDGREGIDNYLGKTVRIKVLLRLSEKPSVRLLTILDEAIYGVELKYIGTMSENRCIRLWNNPLDEAFVMPDYASMVLVMEPKIEEKMIGIELSDEKVKPLTISHKNTRTKNAVEIGKAMSSTGSNKRITIGEADLRRHYQIIGQTGTGKSTLLINTMLSAINNGYGLTFFDPHGSTVDMLLQCIPESRMKKVRVVRVGDTKNPVPLNIWDSDDPLKEERNISDFCELISDIFDPYREGFVGPRYERWLSTFCKASIALLGRRASLESIAVLSQSQKNMKRVASIIRNEYPELADSIMEEYVKDEGKDFTATLNWYLCKFQRLTAVEQLRKTLGAGTNALKFNKSIDTDTVTLVDLASPVIGTHASRIVGTLLLMKLWNATMCRKRRDKTHMVVVDEASLFMTNPMPRMLAESRKFGLSMVLCHQHTGQLTYEIREALEANSANFSAFRLSTKDAKNAATRFDDLDMVTSLTRLDAFNAITTLSVDGQQTSPFTLMINRPKKQKNGSEIAKKIEEYSKKRLVEPYKSLKALSPAEIISYLEEPSKYRFYNSVEEEEIKENIELAEDEQAIIDEPYWLTKWRESRKAV